MPQRAYSQTYALQTNRGHPCRLGRIQLENYRGEPKVIEACWVSSFGSQLVDPILTGKTTLSRTEAMQRIKNNIKLSHAPSRRYCSPQEFGEMNAGFDVERLAPGSEFTLAFFQLQSRETTGEVDTSASMSSNSGSEEALTGGASSDIVVANQDTNQNIALHTSHVQDKLSVSALPQMTFFPTNQVDSATSNRTEPDQSVSLGDLNDSTSNCPSEYKRQRDGSRKPHDRDENSGEEDDGNRKKKRKLKVTNDELEPRRRLKCPFCLRRPEEHTRGSCRGGGFTDMGKLKDHLKRVHTRPRQCLRCWEEFSSEEARLSHQQDQTCLIQTEPKDHRMRYEQLQSFNFNRVPYANARNVEEKWKMMYRQLFPDDRHVPSPYDEYGLGPDFDRLLAQTLAKEFRKELNLTVDTVDDISLQQRLLEIIRHCKMLALHGSEDISTSQVHFRVSEPEGPLSTPVLPIQENSDTSMPASQISSPPLDSTEPTTAPAKAAPD